jgi:hypothetical protein
MADQGLTQLVGAGAPSTVGAADNRFETQHNAAPTQLVGGRYTGEGQGSVGATDNRFESIIAGGAPPVDSTPPVITNFVPAPGTQLGRFQPLQFDLTDDIALKRGMVIVAMGGRQFVVHDGDTFAPGFTGNRTPLTDPFGFRFTNVKANDGWLEHIDEATGERTGPQFRFLVTDTAGSEAT